MVVVVWFFVDRGWFVAALQCCSWFLWWLMWGNYAYIYISIYKYRYIDIKFFFDFWLGRILNCNTATLQRLGGVLGRGLILSNMCLVEDVDGMLLGVRKKSYFCKILMVGWFWKNGCFNLKIK